MRNTPKEVFPIECNPEAMSREQKRFYTFWLQELSNGRRVETEDSLTYISIYLDSLAERFVKNKNTDYFLGQIRRISDVYHGTERLEPFLSIVKSQIYLFVGDYEKAWYFLRMREYISVRDVLNIRGKCIETILTGEDLFKIVGKPKSKLTRFGFQNLPAVVNHISSQLSDAYQRDQRNFVEKYCQQFDFEKLTDCDLGKLCESIDDPILTEYLKLQYKHEMQQTLAENEVRRINELHSKYRIGVRVMNNSYANDSYRFWQSHRGLFRNGYHIPEPFVPLVVIVAIENLVGELFRESENRLREKEGLPRIGEGWISETELFRNLQKQFPAERIVKHAKPSWLAPQHLDIYFLTRNIGIEYQGTQHQKPVDYFGGWADFESQKARDEKKRRLCEENKCQLIYVYESYSFSELVREIESLLSESL